MATPQDRVYPGLIARIPPEMFEHLSIQPDADLFLRLRHDKFCRGKPVGINNRCRIRVITSVGFDFICGLRVKARPVSSAAPQPAALLH
jgi:hypothetical protein